MSRFVSLSFVWALAASAARTEPPPRVDRNPPSGGQKISKSSAALAEMRTALSAALLKLEEARNAKDIVKLNCVNEKLTQVKGLLRISEEASVVLQEAIAKKEQLAADHEYTKITIASERVRSLRAETEECIGQLAFRADQNLTVEVEVPDDLPMTDPTVPPRIGLPSTRPPPASPTQ